MIYFREEAGLWRVGHTVPYLWPHCANKDQIYTEHVLCVPISGAMLEVIEKSMLMLHGEGLTSPPSACLTFAPLQKSSRGHINAFINAFPWTYCKPTGEWWTDPHNPREKGKGEERDRDRLCSPPHLWDGAVKCCLADEELVWWSVPLGSEAGAMNLMKFD